jgi:hypothetical protein
LIGGLSAIEIEGELDRNREKIAGIRDKVRPYALVSLESKQSA